MSEGQVLPTVPLELEGIFEMVAPRSFWPGT